MFSLLLGRLINRVGLVASATYRCGTAKDSHLVPILVVNFRDYLESSMCVDTLDIVDFTIST